MIQLKFLLVVAIPLLRILEGAYVFKQEASADDTNQLAILSDIWSEENYIKVFITPENNLEMYNQMKDITTPTIIIEKEKFVKSQCKEIRVMEGKLNKKALYILVDIKENITTVIDTIKSTDKRSKIVTLSNEKVDAEIFYADIVADIAGTVNVYLLSPANENDRYELYEICRHCNHGEDSINTINVWKSHKGFTKLLEFPPSFKGTFNGGTFIVGTLFYPPYIYKNGTDADGNDIITGTYLYDELEVLSDVVNAKFKYVPGPSYRALYNMLHTNVIQMQGWEASLQKYSTYKISSSFYTSFDQRAILSKKPPRGLVWYAFINVFDRYTWGFLLLSWFVGGTVLYILRKLSAKDEDVKVMQGYWNLTPIITFDTIDQGGLNDHLPLLAGYTIAMFMLLVFYGGDLAAMMVTPEYLWPPIDSIEQLWETDKIVLTYWGGDKKYSKSYNKSMDRFEDFALGGGSNWFGPAMDKIKEEPEKYVSFERRVRVLEEVLVMFAQDRNKNHEYYISKNGFDVMFTNFLFPADSYYEELVNRGILQMQANGVIDYIYEWWLIVDRLDNAEAERNRPIIEQPSSLVSMTNGFGVGLAGWAVGTLVSILVFLVIKLVHWKKGRSKRPKKIEVQ